MYRNTYSIVASTSDHCLAGGEKESWFRAGGRTKQARNLINCRLSLPHTFESRPSVCCKAKGWAMEEGGVLGANFLVIARTFFEHPFSFPPSPFCFRNRRRRCPQISWKGVGSPLAAASRGRNVNIGRREARNSAIYFLAPPSLEAQHLPHGDTQKKKL